MNRRSRLRRRAHPLMTTLAPAVMVALVVLGGWLTLRVEPSAERVDATLLNDTLRIPPGDVASRPLRMPQRGTVTIRMEVIDGPEVDLLLMTPKQHRRYGAQQAETQPLRPVWYLPMLTEFSVNEHEAQAWLTQGQYARVARTAKSASRSAPPQPSGSTHLSIAIQMVSTTINRKLDVYPLLDEEERTFLTRINDYRNEHDRCWTGQSWVRWPPTAIRTLGWSEALSQAALAHNRTMIELNCFAHICPGEPDLSSRALTAGYTSKASLVTENIAAGYETADQVFRGWKTSEGHNKNMLACAMEAIGIARSQEATSRYRWYWTTDFGDVHTLASDF